MQHFLGEGMKERTVTNFLKIELQRRGLICHGKLDIFNHETDDLHERSFKIDLTFGPIGTKGNRTEEQAQLDRNMFNQYADILKSVVDELIPCCVFPDRNDREYGFRSEPNQNSVVGIAVEVENAKSKYFLGSLLAASIAGRWGFLIVPDTIETDRWIETLRRMRYKCSHDPIPSNIYIFKWPQLQEHLLFC